MKIALFIASLSLIFSSCAQIVHVKTDVGVVSATIDDIELGAVPGEGVQVEIDQGVASVPYTVTDAEGNVHEGNIPRSEVSWTPMAFGLAGACIGLPICALAGYSLANPALTMAPITCFTAASFSGFGSVCVAPSPQTIPCVMMGAAMGLTPASLFLVAEDIPSVVILGLPADGAHKVSEHSTSSEPPAPPMVQKTERVLY